MLLRWCKPRCETVTVLGSLRWAAIGRDGWAPTSGSASSIGCSTPCSAPGKGFENTTGTLAPRAAVPAGAVVIAFSTLLDTEFALALIDLRKRGHVVVAVDVLDSCPLQDQLDPLVVRMWALQRSAMYRDMATIGVDVLSWPADHSLQQSMGALPNRRRRGRGRASRARLP